MFAVFIFKMHAPCFILGDALWKRVILSKREQFSLNESSTFLKRAVLSKIEEHTYEESAANLKRAALSKREIPL